MDSRPNVIGRSSKTCEDVAESVYRSAKSGNLSLTLGGDHSLVSSDDSLSPEQC